MASCCDVTDPASLVTGRPAGLFKERPDGLLIERPAELPVCKVGDVTAALLAFGVGSLDSLASRSKKSTHLWVND